MNIGDKVLIGGRTMLRPNFPLAGLQGVVMPSAHNVPTGCTTVLIDWQEQGYLQTEDLPPFVNIPTIYLELVATSISAAIELPQLSSGLPSQTSRPALGLVRDELEDTTLEEIRTPAFSNIANSDIANKGNAETTNAEALEESASAERPRLRLL